jgi:precorrin-2 dehydrogenase/sirohydrochlorin ferrochelatase
VLFVDGRGPAGKLTLYALRALAEADAVAADADADPAVLMLARRDARRLQGAEADRLADLTGQGLQLVRVTGAADPAREMAALAEAGVRAERV